MKTSAERLQQILNQLDENPYQFATGIGLPRADILYNVLKGKNEIGKKLAKKIRQTYPNIWLEWLMDGTGEQFEWGDKPEKKPMEETLNEEKIKYIKGDNREKDLIIEDLRKQLEDQKYINENLKSIVTEQRELIKQLKERQV